MVIRIIASSFVLGMALGCGPCLASCGPLLLTYLAGTGKNVLKSIGAYLLFSFSRIFVYLILGLLVFFLGRYIFERFNYFFRFILVGAGVFIILLGILMLLGKEMNSTLCAFLQRNMLEKDRKSIIILGILAGLLPCAPLITVLAYAGLTAKNGLENLLYTFAFGLGTTISPLIILAALAGLLPNFLKRFKKNYAQVFNIICGLIMILLGSQLFRRTS